jgi:hypothetical protein
MLSTISPPLQPYWCPPRTPPRAIAQRFSALAHCGGSRQRSKMPAMEAKRTVGGRDQHRRT